MIDSGGEQRARSPAALPAASRMPKTSSASYSPLTYLLTYLLTYSLTYLPTLLAHLLTARFLTCLLTMATLTCGVEQAEDEPI